MARTLARRLADAGSPEAERAELLARTADEAKRQVRALIRNVAPVEVVADGLMAALAELAEATDRGFQPECVFECSRDVPLEDNFVATQLYLIAQESVHNAVKHAGARRIRIRLEGDGQDVWLWISDDGCGLPADADTGHDGMGLAILRHRAGLIGAELSLGPAADVDAAAPGTCVTCHLPRAR
jgi:signal transduction histidine kinase